MLGRPAPSPEVPVDPDHGAVVQQHLVERHVRDARRWRSPRPRRRPSNRRPRSTCAERGPPTGSTATSAPPPVCSRIDGLQVERGIRVVDGDLGARRAPRARASSGVDAHASTRAPIDVARSVAARPTPPPAPRTTTHSPGARVMRRVNAYSMVPYDATSPAACPAESGPGHWCELVLAQHRVRLEARGERRAEHAVADREPRDVVTDRDDGAGQLAAGHPWQRGQRLVRAVDAERVDEADAPRPRSRPPPGRARAPDRRTPRPRGSSTDRTRGG